MKPMKVIITAMCLLALSPNLFAHVLGARANVTAYVESISPGVWHTVPGTSLWVFANAGQRMVVSYNAECSVRDNTNSSYLNVDVMLNGVVGTPSNHDDALCTSHSNNLGQNWVTATRDVILSAPSTGWHLISVRARALGANSFRLDDMLTYASRF